LVHVHTRHWQVTDDTPLSALHFATANARRLMMVGTPETRRFVDWELDAENQDLVSCVFP
jgi:hypothetical protein